ncbi:hypothetical protein DHEL01_v212225 [Diaporthe helianthi]|uniref:Uncharacterized protein n=1 Tax=Diaporthe helianthi TaxID=158607 RepID=A0A2P5HGK5_DIAHE|nr:hypothetical protein DHEL01_v212225 [Diaporthe helianthi]
MAASNPHGLPVYVVVNSIDDVWHMQSSESIHASFPAKSILHRFPTSLVAVAPRSARQGTSPVDRQIGLQVCSRKETEVEAQAHIQG